MEEFTNDEILECEQRIDEIEKNKKEEGSYLSTCSEAEQQEYIIKKYSKCEDIAKQLNLNIVKVGK